MIDASSLKSFAAKLRELPRVVAIRVASEAAAKLTEISRSTFNSGENAFGEAWEPGEKGQAITLRKSGALASRISFAAVGQKLRAALGVGYAKYQVGKRPVFPRQGDPLPPSYARALAEIAARVIREELGGRR